MATFAERLKIALQKKGMKQTILAYRIGVDRSYISNYLSGKYKPSADTHNKIAEVLGVSSAWLSGYFGHEDITTTLNIYAEVREDRIREAGGRVLCSIFAKS